MSGTMDERVKRLLELGRWAEAHYAGEMLIREDDGRVRPVGNLEGMAMCVLAQRRREADRLAGHDIIS